MAGELIKLYEENPSISKLTHIADVLRKGGTIIYPTDTIYGIGCDIFNSKAVEKLCRFKGIKPKKANLSFICYDISDVSAYVRGLTTPIFKVMKKALPGPFTFIMNASSQAPKSILSSKKTVGIRIPDNNIPRELVKQLGNPIVTTSLHHEDEIVEYLTDPYEIFERYKNQVDIVIDGGYGKNKPSTVIDVTEGDFRIIREGIGDINEFI